MTGLRRCLIVIAYLGFDAFLIGMALHLFGAVELNGSMQAVLLLVTLTAADLHALTAPKGKIRKLKTR